MAATFGLGSSTIVKWWQRFRGTTKVAPKPRGGSKVRFLVEVRDWLLERVSVWNKLRPLKKFGFDRGKIENPQ